MSTDLTQANTALSTNAVPEYLQTLVTQGGAPIGLDIIRKKVVPPRLKIIQDMASPELKAVWNVGDVIISPSGLLVIRQLIDEHTHKPIGKSEEFFFVPLFYYPEFICVNPHQLKSTLPMIRERTLDPTSQLGRDCQVFEKRQFACPEDARFMCTRSEVFNFIVFLLTPDERYGDIVCMSFRSGEFKAGQNFASLIMSRKVGSKPVPLFANMFAATCGPHKHKNGNTSYGLDIANPRLKEFNGPGHYVEDYELFQYLTAQHVELQQAYNDRTLEVDYEDEPSDNPGSAVPSTNPDGSSKY